MQPFTKDAGRWAGLAVSAAALTVYVLTLAPGLTFKHFGTDGGDLVAAARTLGVPHPSGYPTYTLLAWLASHVPFGSIAHRVNLFSALCAAASAGLVFCSARYLLPARHNLPVAAATALSFAFCPLLWSQAVISEVYTLLALFAALILYLLARWRRQGGTRLLWLAAGALGLGLGNHLTLIFILVPAAAILWPERSRWLNRRTVLACTAFFALGLAVYAYLPLAAARHPPIAWGDPRTWDRFLWTVTAKAYQPLLAGLEPRLLPERLRAWAALLADQFGWWGLILISVGILTWWKRDRTAALSATLWAAFFFFPALLYGSGDAQVYLLPCLLILAICWGQGVCYGLEVTRRLRAPWPQLALASVLLLPAGSLVLHWSGIDLSDDRDAALYVDQTLSTVAPGSLVLTQADRPTFALWYALYAEERRPDVTVVNVALLGYDWYRDQLSYLYPGLRLSSAGKAGSTDDIVRDLVVRNYTQRAVYSTDPSAEWTAWFDLVREGNSSVYRVQLKTRWEQER